MLAALYGGLDTPRPWIAFLESLSAWMDASYAVLIIATANSALPGTFLAPGADAGRSSDYVEGFFADDPFRGLPDGQVTAFSDFIANQPADRYAAYREYLRLAGGEQVLGVDLRFDKRFEARFRVMRIDDLPDFTARDRRRLQALVPHLRIAATLYERLQFQGAQHSVYHSATDGLGLGVLILDRERRIVSSNALAERFLDEGEGLRRTGDTLSFVKPEVTRHVIELLGNAPPTERVQRFRIERARHGDLIATARAIDLPAIHSGTGALALFLSRPGAKPPIDPDTLRSLFGLTAAEARLALLLAGGDSLTSAARTLGISPNTAKTQLRAIFAKTDTRRQAQLAAKLALLAG